jgi:hypothetical protein
LRIAISSSVATPQKSRQISPNPNFNFIDNPGIADCFSLDGNFLKLSYLDGLERIFALDPGFILDRMNDPAIMGTIAGLSAEDKKRLLIEVDSNPD